jgi:hypothetical protein
VHGLLGILPKQVGLSHDSLLIWGHHVAAFWNQQTVSKCSLARLFELSPAKSETDLLPLVCISQSAGTRRWDVRMLPYAADNSIGSMIDGLSFSGLLTRF